MTDKAQQKQCMAKYLLGRMSEEERADFEKQYLVNEELFEELVVTETETIRSYLSGSGSEAERREFQSHFLATPSKRRKVEFEKSLGEYVARHAPSATEGKSHAPGKASFSPLRAGTEGKRQLPLGPAKPRLALWRFAAAAMVLVTLTGGLWLVLVNRRLSHEIQQLHLEQSQRQQQEQQLRRQIADLDVQLHHERTITSDQQQLIAQLQSPDLAVGVFTLAPGLARRVDQQRPLVIPHGLSSVHLQLRLDRDEYPQYAVSLETAEGSRIWQQQNLISLKSRKGQHLIALKVPSNLLQSRTYILTVTGATADGNSEEVAAYAFRIVRQ